MLVLTRRDGERIFVGNDIVITIFKIRPDRVSVGIEAPADVVIVREEIAGKEPRDGLEPKGPQV